jgi:hypothetical protein
MMGMCQQMVVLREQAKPGCVGVVVGKSGKQNMVNLNCAQ